MIFQRDGLTVRLLTDADKQLLVQWLSNPSVLAFYEGRDNPHDLDKVNQNFYEDPDENVTRCLIEYEQRPIGYIQFYPLDNQSKVDYGYDENEIIYGTDQFIGETLYWNRGIGKLLITSIVAYLCKKKGAHKVIMDPQSWNTRAIHCYESCGFKKSKLLPKHEWHEGEYKDCWLMEYSHS